MLLTDSPKLRTNTSYKSMQPRDKGSRFGTFTENPYGIDRFNFKLGSFVDFLRKLAFPLHREYEVFGDERASP